MERISEHRLRIPHGDAALLAIRTSIPPRRYLSRQITSLARGGATILSDEGHSPWPINRVIPVDGEYVLAGPMIDGETLEELLHVPPRAAPPPWLTACFRMFLRSMTQREFRLANIRTSLVTRDKGVLLLNTELAREINRSMPEPERTRVYEPYADERLSGDNAAAFQIAAIVYHALTGIAPAPRSEDANRVVTPIHSHVPALHHEIARLIDTILTGESREEPALLQEIERVRHDHGGWLESISTEERESRLAAASEAELATSRSRRRRSFRQRNRTRLVVAAAAVIIIGAVPFSMIRSRLQPPVTAGLDPIELVEGFYRAWTNLDHVFMDDAVARGVARDAIREVTNIYVIDRVQTAHAMHSRFISPEEWLDMGKPADLIPYGVSDTAVEIQEQKETHLTLLGTYYLWRPESNDGAPDDSAPGVSRTLVEDRLRLEQTRHGWEISGIDRRFLEQETIRDGVLPQ